MNDNESNDAENYFEGKTREIMLLTFNISVPLAIGELIDLSITLHYSCFERFSLTVLYKKIKFYKCSKRHINLLNK